MIEVAAHASLALGLLFIGMVTDLKAEPVVDDHLRKAHQFEASGELAAAAIDYKNALTEDSDRATRGSRSP
jgi:hypothetical protein